MVNIQWNFCVQVTSAIGELHLDDRVVLNHQLRSSLARVVLPGAATELAEPVAAFQLDVDLAGELPPCTESGVLWLLLVCDSFEAAVSAFGT